MSSKKSGAQFIAESLQGYGVTHVFYVEAILRRTMVEMEKLGIKRVLAHSEKAAAYMADGYARVSNKPGVCAAQSVGAANLAAALQDAYLGQVPIVAFTGRKPPIFQYRNAYQEIDHNRMFEPVTKYNAEVTTLDQIPHLLAQAFREATTGTPLPVHLDFLGYEGDKSDLEEGEIVPLNEPEYAQAPARRPVPEEKDIAGAAQAIARSKKPVIVVGRGAVVSGAHQEVRALAEAVGAGVAFSMDAKEIILDEHPLAVGPVGTYCRPCANQAVSEADLVIFIGSETGDQVTKNWTLPPVGSAVIQIDIDPAEVGRNYPGTVGVHGDPRTATAMLVEVVGKTADTRTAWAARITELVDAWRASMVSACTSEDEPIRTECLCAEITHWLPSDAVVVADTGYSAIWAGTLINLLSPDQRFIRAAGSLGWAYPASLGAKCAAPDRPVVCFSGDGAFWYHLTELETALRWDIPTVTVVNNNSVLGQSQLGIRRAYAGEGGKEEQQYRFRDTNFAAIAEAMGAVGIRVTKPGEIRPALEKALASGKPAVVDVVTESESHPVLK